MSTDLEKKYSEDILSKDEQFQAPPSNWLKFGKIGNVIRGTLVGVSERESSIVPGKMQKIYEIKAELGYFHDIVDKKVADEPTELNTGEAYFVGGKKIIDNSMRGVRIGQRVELRYTADFEMKGGNVAKTIEVKVGDMDPDYSAE